jgi:hypothetical protein
MPDRPTDPMISRVGMAAGCEAEMHACSRSAEKIKRRRSGMVDPESKELSRQVGELFHRQAGIYHLLSVALLPVQKRERPLTLWGHLRVWWASRR